MPWLPRAVKGREAMEMLRVMQEEGLGPSSRHGLAERFGVSYVTVWRRIRWLEENYPMRSGIRPHWNGHPQRNMPNSGAVGDDGWTYKWPQRRVGLPVPDGYVAEPVVLPEFELDGTEVLEDEIEIALKVRTLMRQNLDTADSARPVPRKERA